MPKGLYNTDNKIIEGILAGDEMALRVLYKLYYTVIYKFIVNNQGNEDDAKDIYQEGIIIVHNNILNGVFKQESGLKTYLYSVCRRLWLTELKSRAKVYSKVYDSADVVNIPNEEVEEAAFDSVQFKRLEKSLEHLGEPCRTIIYDFYILHRSMQDIAEKMNYTNTDNAKTQKYKCLQRLKKIFFDK